MRRKPLPAYRRAQRGAALAIALILLVLASLLGAAGYLASTSEVRGAIGWSDRQRALFLAESALREAEQVLAGKVKGVTDIESTIRAAGTGYYVRADNNLPAYNPWNTTRTIKATAIDTRASDAYYMIVYEGLAPAFGSELVGANGAANPASSTRARFTLYARAGGIREGTGVTLSVSREY